LDHVTCLFLLAYQRQVERPLLVGAEKYGRIGNRLYLASHLVAWARKTSAELLNPGFHGCEDLFEATFRDALCRYPEPSDPVSMSRGFKDILGASIDRASIRFLQNPSRNFQTIDLQPAGPDIGDPGFKASLVSKPVTFIRGFVYDNSQPDIAEEHPAIHHFFRPRKQFVAGIEEPIRELRQSCEIILGIVIRHGDFKTWRGGEFYFETKDYVRLMERAAGHLAPRRVGFFIASDEEQPHEAFQGHNYYFRAGHPLENLGALSLCDGLLAAESSFTGWAQYYGRVPTFHISHEIDPDHFEETLEGAATKALAA
jgi:hypothetical protein